MKILGNNDYEIPTMVDRIPQGYIVMNSYQQW